MFALTKIRCAENSASTKYILSGCYGLFLMVCTLYAAQVPNVTRLRDISKAMALAQSTVTYRRERTSRSSSCEVGLGTPDILFMKFYHLKPTISQGLSSGYCEPWLKLDTNYSEAYPQICLAVIGLV